MKDHSTWNKWSTFQLWTFQFPIALKHSNFWALDHHSTIIAALLLFIFTNNWLLNGTTFQTGQHSAIWMLHYYDSNQSWCEVFQISRDGLFYQMHLAIWFHQSKVFNGETFWASTTTSIAGNPKDTLWSMYLHFPMECPYNY